MRPSILLLVLALFGCSDEVPVPDVPAPPVAVDAPSASESDPADSAGAGADAPDFQPASLGELIDTSDEALAEPVTVTLGDAPAAAEFDTAGEVIADVVDVESSKAGANVAEETLDALADAVADANAEIPEGAPDEIANDDAPDRAPDTTETAPTVMPAAVALTQALESFDTLQARFLQRVEDSRGTLLREATGSLEASRPERFRWEVETPFAELLIGDGRTLWLWDPDLEQVTIRPYDERLAETPARLLSGSADELVRNFDITARTRTEQRSVYELRPLAGEGLFERLEIIFSGEIPRALIVYDSLGQRTEVLFADVEVDVALPDARFTFEIPEGADVLREDAVGPDADG